MDMPSVLQPVEKLAKGLVSVILAVSLVAARADFLWLGNSELLKFSAGQKQRKQTIWLRRILLLEVSFRTAITLAQYSLSHYTFTLYLMFLGRCDFGKHIFKQISLPVSWTMYTHSCRCSRTCSTHA